jgi:hypothetical protein
VIGLQNGIKNRTLRGRQGVSMDMTYIIMDKVPKFTKNSSTTNEELEIIKKTDTSLRKIDNKLFNEVTK